jgi:hypothetical protein
VPLLVAACATTQGASAPETPYVPTGEVVLRNRTASFDATRVRSPYMNLSRRSDGSWGGVIKEYPVDFSVTDTRISGVNFSMTREESEGRHLIITGQFQGRIFRFEFDTQRALIRAPTTSATFEGMKAADGVVRYGPMGNLELRGEAASARPPWPQIGLALVGGTVQ